MVPPCLAASGDDIGEIQPPCALFERFGSRLFEKMTLAQYTPVDFTDGSLGVIVEVPMREFADTPIFIAKDSNHSPWIVDGAEYGEGASV